MQKKNTLSDSRRITIVGKVTETYRPRRQAKYISSYGPGKLLRECRMPKVSSTRQTQKEENRALTMPAERLCVTPVDLWPQGHSLKTGKVEKDGKPPKRHSAKSLHNQSNGTTAPVTYNTPYFLSENLSLSAL